MMKYILLLVFLKCISNIAVCEELANTKPNKLFAAGVKASYENGIVWSIFQVHKAKEQIVQNIGPGSIVEKDTRSLPESLGYHSLKVEKGIIIVETIDLTKISVPLDVAVLVDDKAVLTVEGKTNGFSYSHTVNGTAIWNPKSYQLLRVQIPPGDSYTFTVDYTNNSNLTKQYGEKRDIDGVAVYLYPSQPVLVDLDIDSNNNEGVTFRSPGSVDEDAIEADPSLPGKIVYANIGGTDGVPDWADGFNIDPKITEDDNLAGSNQVLTAFALSIKEIRGYAIDPADITVQFRYNGSNPTAVEVLSSPLKGYILPPGGDARIWTVNTDSRNKESVVKNGHFVPANVDIKWSDLVSSGGDEVVLYYECLRGEGLKNITVDVKIKRHKPIPNADSVNLTHQYPFIVDLDIDSNNNEGVIFSSPGSDAEDKLEDDRSQPGKIVFRNDGITDGVPDWADGFNINSAITEDDSLNDTKSIFTEFELNLKLRPELKNLDTELDEIYVIFNYSASDPSGVVSTKISPKEYTYTLPPGNARIWTENTDTRKKESFIKGGNFIPNGTRIKWTDLAGKNDKVTLYYENVNGLGLQDISVDVDIKGNAILTERDKVNISHVKVKWITPAGDPVRVPVDRGVGQNEYTYDNSSAGVFKMKLVVELLGVKKLPELMKNNLVFVVGDERSNITWEVLTWGVLNQDGKAVMLGNQYKADVTVRRLPKNNSDFGQKFVSFKFCNTNGTKQLYEIFFDKTATNNPEGKDPNWFYYWKEGQVCGIPKDAKYNPAIAYGRVTGGINSVLELGPLASAKNNGPETFISPTYGPITVTGQGKGIACVAETSAHELRHVDYRKLMGIFTSDDDSDGISDKNEATLEGVMSDPKDPDTYNMSPTYPGYADYGDNEVRCRKRELTHRPVIYPKKDWAKPGCQNKNQYGPIPK